MEGTFDLRLKHPCCVQISAFSGSGKTFIAAKIVRFRNRLFTEKIKQVVWLYKHWQPIYDDLKKEVNGIIFTNKLEEIADYTSSSDATLVVIDDFVTDMITQQNKFLPLFLELSHHGNNSILILTQSLFIPGSRLALINCQYLLVLKLARDSSSLYRLAYQILPSSPKQLYKAYQHSVNSRPYGTFLMDSHPHQDDRVRFRSNIFFWENDCYVYVIKND